jgi:hypothetical protein
MRQLRYIPFEAIIWFGGLVILAFLNPIGSHFTLCPLHNLGFDFCPGCGLGKSISFLFRGQVAQSFKAHPLGIFAVIVLSLRILNLLKNFIKSYGQNN